MSKIAVQAIVVPGDPTEELLYQGRAQQADLIVLGAQGASAFAAITRHGVVYKVLAHAHCPVIDAVAGGAGGRAAKRKAGNLTGNTGTEVRGAVQQVKGKVETAIGKTKDAVRDAKRNAAAHHECSTTVKCGHGETTVTKDCHSL
jgi:uncharacterized protein YjbJ (UPF0337 family)